MLRLNDIKELRFTSKTVRFEAFSSFVIPIFCHSTVFDDKNFLQERKDVKMKVDKAKTFMDRGHRVKVYNT